LIGNRKPHSVAGIAGPFFALNLKALAAHNLGSVPGDQLAIHLAIGVAAIAVHLVAVVALFASFQITVSTAGSKDFMETAIDGVTTIVGAIVIIVAIEGRTRDTCTRDALVAIGAK